jgi:sec-independent protein translocase protein TatA
VIPTLPQVGGTELLILLVIIPLLFGAERIPQLARSIGTGTREFRKGISGAHDDQDEDAQGAENPGKAEESPQRGAPSAERTPDAGQKAQVPRAERQSLATGSHLCGRKSTSSCNTAGLRSSALRRKERADDKRYRAERTATRANQAGLGIR